MGHDEVQGSVESVTDNVTSNTTQWADDVSVNVVTTTKDVAIRLLGQHSNRVRCYPIPGQHNDAFHRLVIDGVDTAFVKCNKCEEVIKYTSSKSSGYAPLRNHLRRCTSASSTKTNQTDLRAHCFSTSSSRHQKLKSSLLDFTVDFLVATGQSFHLTDTQPFHEVVDRVARASLLYSTPNISAALPSRRTLTRRIDSRARQAREQLALLARTIRFPTFTTDVWTCEFTKISYLSCTLHYVDDEFEVHATSTGAAEIHGSKDACNVRQTLLRHAAIIGFDVSSPSVTVVADGAANISAVWTRELDSMRSTRLRCLAHAINNCVKNAINDTAQTAPAVGRLINDAKRLVTYVKRSDTNGQLTRSLKQESNVRWLSCQAMLISVRDAYDELTDLLPQRGEHIEEMLLSIDRVLLVEVIDFLTGFNDAILLLEGDKAFTAHIAAPTISNLRKKCAHAEISVKIGPVARAASARLKKLEEDILDDSRRAATFLHPGFDPESVFDADTVRRVQNLVTTEARLLAASGERTSVGVTDRDTVISSTSEPLDAHAASVTRIDDFSRFTSTAAQQLVTAADVIDDELQWLEKSRHKIASSSIGCFWADAKAHAPNLALLAQKYLAIPATSASSERQFSRMKRLLHEKRSSLSPKTVDNLVVLSACL